MTDEVQLRHILRLRKIQQSAHVIVDRPSQRRIGKRDSADLPVCLEPVLQHAQLETRHPQSMDQHDQRQRTVLLRIVTQFAIALEP